MRSCQEVYQAVPAARTGLAPAQRIPFIRPILYISLCAVAYSNV